MRKDESICDAFGAFVTVLFGAFDAVIVCSFESCLNILIVLRWRWREWDLFVSKTTRPTSHPGMSPPPGLACMLVARTHAVRSWDRERAHVGPDAWNWDSGTGILELGFGTGKPGFRNPGTRILELGFGTGKPGNPKLVIFSIMLRD